MRVTLAEDATLLRDGLARLLEDEGHEVVAAVRDADALLAAVEADTPDVVVADVRMPPTHTDEGLRAVLDIRAKRPGVGVLVLSQYVEKRYAVELFTAHTDGVGYLLKDRVAHVDDFLDALERVGTGGAAFDAEVVRQLIARSRRPDPLGRLSPRERAVLELMAQGHTNAGVAAAMHLSTSAVEKHVNTIFDKLDLRDTDGYSRRVLAVLRYLDS
ncbi:LuxR family two component transcriptional regulator [Haloactinopolyspora alba]|uniref:LuxR family two component transcriptional regulator n=1 Tax=Haloactinopolyspora alba TaxID=648780 RepID=A0A2P8E2F3_9ACTN|nr:response regulator transcription factor [Haloactinopolyspora alba]PSL03577.1 LuxR family two component transcriptional regulator [Haloactinopolyspora alba]